MKFRPAVFMALLLTTAQIAAADRVLLPVRIGPAFPGAFGSLWAGELWVHNAGTGVARVRTIDNLCELITCPDPFVEIAPGATIQLQSTPSMILVSAAQEDPAPDVRFNARIFDESRQFQDWGTEIPLVREHDFVSGRVVLNNVPLEDSFRQTVRVYEWLGGPSDVQLRAFDAETGLVVGESVVSLTPELFSPDELDFGFFEGNLKSVVGTGAAKRLRLEISPAPGKKIWAFVSITHNETQRVTLITPQ